MSDDYKPLNIKSTLILNATPDDLGREVRRIWVECASENPDSPADHLWEYDDPRFDERNKEIDRRIGEGIARLALASAAKRGDGGREVRDNPYMARHQERASRMCALLIEAGFTSVFEHIQPIMNSQRVWTLWINMTSGEDVLTMVDHMGRIDFYRLVAVKSAAIVRAGEGEKWITKR